MALPTVSRFCFCASLKTATTFGGFLSFLDNGISCLIHIRHVKNIQDESLTLLIFLYVITTISILTTLSMIVGSAKEKYRLMQPFLAFDIIDIHITTLISWYGMYKLFGDSWGTGLIAFFLGHFSFGFAVYYWFVVYSRYIQIYPQQDMENGLLDEPIA